MRIAVYLPHQELTEKAAHETSRKLAGLIVLGYARIVGQNAIQLTTAEPWKAVKARFKPAPPSTPQIPQIKPPRAPEGLLLTYPLRNQTSYDYRRDSV